MDYYILHDRYLQETNDSVKRYMKFLEINGIPTGGLASMKDRVEELRYFWQFDYSFRMKKITTLLEPLSSNYTNKVLTIHC